MQRHGTGSTLALALLLGACSSSRELHTRPAAAPPNVVVVFTDDMGWGDLGLQGAEGFATPNLDRLAAEGMRFTDFYVAQPVCSASRAALLTGLLPEPHRHRGRARARRTTHGLADGEVTLAELCKPRGYATAIFGKWHLGHQPPFLPTRHGFDEYFGLPVLQRHVALPSRRSPNAACAAPAADRWTGDRVVDAEDHGGPDAVSPREYHAARGRVHRPQSRAGPFFLYVAAPDAARAAASPRSAFRGSSRARALRRRDRGDRLVGRAHPRRARARTGSTRTRWSSSPPTTDRGCPTATTPARPARCARARARPSRAACACRASCAGRARSRPAASCDEPAMTIDLLPTIAALIGRRAARAHRIDGLDIWPLICGRAGARSPHEALFFYYHQNDLRGVARGPLEAALSRTATARCSGREPGSGGDARQLRPRRADRARAVRPRERHRRDHATSPPSTPTSSRDSSNWPTRCAPTWGIA